MNKNERQEIPIGLAMSLALNEFAMEYYAGLDKATHDKITKYVQSGNTGKEAKERIASVIHELENKNISFLD